MGAYYPGVENTLPDALGDDCAHDSAVKKAIESMSDYPKYPGRPLKIVGGPGLKNPRGYYHWPSRTVFIREFRWFSYTEKI